MPKKQLHTPDSEARKRLRPRKAIIDPTVSTHFQSTVLAIPELRDLITEYLGPSHLRTLTAVCRTWRDYWIAQVYKRLLLNRYKRTHVYPKVDLYGHLITTLSVANSRWISILHVLDFTMSYDQTRQILEKVPQLRTLTYKFRGKDIRAEEGSIALASMLKDLEVFSWEGQNTYVRIDHLLQVLKSCKKLTKLTVGDARLVNDFPVPAPAPTPSADTGSATTAETRTETSVAMEIEQVNMYVDDDTDPWTNTSLRSIEFPSMVLGLSWNNRQGNADPNLGRLMGRIPNLTKVCINYTNNFEEQDWGHIIKEGSRLEHIDIRPRQLQQLFIKNSGVADSSLLELAKGPTSSLCDTLQELDLDTCLGITGAGLVKVLESCTGLQALNVRNTRAGTIQLFNGKPWACAKSLRKLELDIMPADGLPALLSAPLVLYSDKEQALIKEKLDALTSLVYLDLRGRALTFEMVEDVKFARLERIILHVPFVTQEATGRYMYARHKAFEWSKPRFPEEWTLHTSASHFSGHLCAVVHASSLPRMPTMTWPF
ncbi:hypothetical protein BGZ59_000995 [Podila verticillata]|nr:hypothetical protein BGZ59_000995 [Podila verticillata]